MSKKERKISQFKYKKKFEFAANCWHDSVSQCESVGILLNRRLRIDTKPNFQTKKIVLLQCLIKPEVHQAI